MSGARSGLSTIILYSEKINPASGDMKIMSTEKQKELTDMSVALCSAGTI